VHIVFFLLSSLSLFSTLDLALVGRCEALVFGAFAQSMKQNANECCQTWNQSNENPELEKPMHRHPGHAD
jgi:hypothetical protein